MIKAEAEALNIIYNLEYRKLRTRLELDTTRPAIALLLVEPKDGPRKSSGWGTKPWYAGLVLEIYWLGNLISN